jgi:hypothetical protein
LSRVLHAAAAVALGLGLSGPALANTRILLDELLASWQGDDAVQFVELRMLEAGQQDVAGAELAIDDPSGDPQRRRFFTFPAGVARGVPNARILVATQGLARVASLQPDFTLPDGALAPRAGRVCYQVRDQFGGVAVVDCLAYGDYPGATAPFGRPTRLTPDNRSLQRVGLTGNNRADWQGALSPTPESNQGVQKPLETLCGDDQISQGEECDGDELAGRSCPDFDFARGKLLCTQCHFDTSRCTACGNGAVNGSEQCDGDDLAEQTCSGLGFTGGTLACTERCKLSTAACDPTFFVPGGGPPASDCLAEWQVSNANGRPGGDGKALPRQRCRDGDAGCDADGIAGSCTFRVVLCLNREDARLARCTPRGIASWTLLRPSATQDPGLAGRLLAVAAALGPSTTAGGAVTFSPPLDAATRCAAPVDVVVARRRTVTASAGGRDLDTLRLACVP